MSINNKINILPIKYPIINSYRYYANLFSIIQNNETYLDWVCNNFLTLEFPSIDYVKSHYFGLCLYTPSRNEYENCPYLRKNFINQDLIDSKWPNIKEFFIDIINLKQYIEVDLNHFYIPHSNKFYNTSHYAHPSLIYGYDITRKIFKIADYFHNSKFSFEEVSFENIIKAHKSTKLNTIDGNNLNNHLILLEYNTKSNYQFDLNLFVHGIKGYLTSHNFRKRISYFGDQSKINYCDFGFKVYTYLKHLLLLFKDKIPLSRAFSSSVKVMDRVDLRNFYALWEHKKLILIMLNHLSTKNYCCLDKQYIMLYKKIEMNAKLVLNLMIKYCIVNDDNLIKKCIQILTEIADEEYIILNKIIDKLDLSQLKPIYYQYHANLLLNK